MTNIQELYEARLQDVKNTTNLIEPKRVPVVSMVGTWSVGYAGESTNDILDHPEKIAEVTTRYYNDIYFDAAYSGGISTAVRAVQRLGSEAFFVSEDGHTIQHKENCPMTENDYQQMIENPIAFIMNVLGTRKYTELQKSPEEAYQALIDAALNFDEFFMSSMIKSKILAQQKYGIVSLLGNGKVYPPLDIIFDRFRGIKGTLVDLRRQRDTVIKATEAVYPISDLLTKSATGDFPYAQCVLHCPTYLGVKDFKEIFFPGMKKLVMEIFNKGAKTLCALEGTWKPYYEILHEELPKGSIICQLEADDICESKKLIGDKFAIMGGVLTNMLRYGTKQQCIDEAKRVVDICAPGGGFMFSTERILCTLGDVNVDNLIAVNQFVHEYGKY